MANRTEINEQSRDIFLFADLTGGQAEGLRAALADPEYELQYSSSVMQAAAIKLSLVICYAPDAPIDMPAVLFAAFDAVRQDHPNVPFVVITDCSSVEFLNECYGRGFSGVIETTLGIAAVKQALRLIAKGGVFVPAHILAKTV